MKNACTIVDKKYVPFATVLYKSLLKFIPDLNFYILVVDATAADNFVAANANQHFVKPPEILHSPFANKIFRKYAHTNRDHLRWALKPVFLIHLLSEREHCIFLDPDVYFVGDPAFLFEDLAAHDALLAPHWSETNPLKYEDGLFSVMRNGLYSGGFIGTNRRSISALEWWAEVCHYKMDESREFGVFVDQKYLDLFHLMLPNMGYVRHPGCNLTNINLLTCRRSIVNGKVKINDSFDPVFIHFTRDTIYNIDRENDPHLKIFLQQYRHDLKAEGYELNETALNFTHQVKKRFLLRTRLKRFLFRLAEKI